MVTPAPDVVPLLPPGPSRRSFLGTSGMIAAGTALATVWTPRPASAEPTATAPVLYRRQVLTARAGSVFTISGTQFAAASQARAWTLKGRSVNDVPARPPGDVRALDVIAVTADAIVLRAPATGGTFALYVSSGDGRSWSTPLVINAPQPWYLDTPQASPRDEVTLYGTNLQSGPARPTVSLVRGARVAPCQVVSASAYHVRFVVPPGVMGRQTLRVSTGRTGAVVTSPLSLAVEPARPGPHRVIDVVAQYGADPSGQQDSTEALQSALTEASRSPAGARVRIPAGTYTLTGKLQLPAPSGPVIVEGAGQGSTVLRISDDVVFSTDLPRNTPTDMYAVSADDNFGMLYLAPGTTPIEIRGLTFDANTRRMVAIELDACDNVTIADVGVENTDYPTDVWLYVGTFGFFAQNLRNLTVQQCDLHCCNGIFMVAVADVRVQDSTFRLAYPRNPSDPNNPQHQADNDGVKVWGGKRLTVRRNHFTRGSTEFYYARAVQTGALKLPAQVFGVRDACGIEDCYFGENFVEQAGQPAGNCGEALVGDQINSAQGGRQALSVSAASATTISTGDVTFAVDDPKLDPLGTTVIVLSGTGVGQLRKVVANSASELTVDEPWDIVPGADSSFVVTATQQRELYIGNTVRSSPKYLGNYGASVLCIAAANDFDSAGAVTANPPGFDWSGVSFISIVGGKTVPIIDVSFYNQILDNRITGGVASLMYDDFSVLSPSIPAAPLMRGNVLAGNTVSQGASAVRLGTPYVINTPVGIMGELTLVSGNISATDVNTVQDIPWNHTVYDGPAGEFTDAGTNSIVV